jgi:hypothetical protein
MSKNNKQRNMIVIALRKRYSKTSYVHKNIKDLLLEKGFEDDYEILPEPDIDIEKINK